jgi:hypothetical protein
MRDHLALSVVGSGLGAGLMFLLDPNMGRRRRALIRDKAFSMMRTASSAADKTARDVKNRVYGTIITAKSGHKLDVRRLSILQRNWPPAIRLLVGVTGGLATAAGLKQGGIVGSVIASIGAGVAAVAITNFSVRDLIDRSSNTAETQMPARPRAVPVEGSPIRTKERRAA